MNKALSLITIVAIGAAVAGCATSSGEHSGFLKDYSQLAPAKDAMGEPVMRYVSPKLTSGAYKKVLIDPVQFYPTPQPSETVDQSTLTAIRNYVDKGLRERMGAKVPLASGPGPDVVRLRPAITAVATETTDLKPYQYIPVAFIVTTAMGRSKQAAIQMEFEAVDSMTSERLGAAVRKGAGAKLEGNEEKLTLEQVRPLLDRWIETGSTFAAEQLR